MAPAEFTIGRLARATGCKLPTIRYDEAIPCPMADCPPIFMFVPHDRGGRRRR